MLKRGNSSFVYLLDLLCLGGQVDCHPISQGKQQQQQRGTVWEKRDVLLGITNEDGLGLVQVDCKSRQTGNRNMGPRTELGVKKMSKGVGVH